VTVRFLSISRSPAAMWWTTKPVLLQLEMEKRHARVIE
jgi:hypothetical protein